MKQLTLGDQFTAERAISIREIPHEDRPRERLQQVGEKSLSATELLSILLINGTQKANVLELARSLLIAYPDLSDLARASIPELTLHDGIGRAKAIRLKAAIEFGYRVQTFPPAERVRVTSPADAAQFLMVEMRILEQEHLKAVLLNTRNEVLGSPTVYIGSINTSVIRICEIFKPAIKANAAAIIVAHNHPSGDPAPSPEDISTTRSLVKAGDLLGISVLDHLIIGRDRYVSLKERRLGFDG